MFQPAFIALQKMNNSGSMMRHDYNLAVICGLARSGTTYVGKILSRARGVHLIHEPLNKDFGVKGVPRWYSYADDADRKNSDDTKKLICDIIHFKAAWSHSSPPEYPLLTRLSKRSYGGRSGLVWSGLRVKKFLGFPFDTVCIKDPFATFAADHLIKSYEAKVICMIRHPCALYLSQKMRGQAAHIEDLFAQPELVDSYAKDIPSRTWKSAMRLAPAGVALLWKIMARTLSSQAKELENLSIVRHEDLCVDPVKAIEGICAHLGISYGPRIDKYINETSRGNRVFAKGGKLHSFKRNSLALMDAWRGEITPQEEEMIQEVVGDDVHLFYERW
jgi:hypothetical protein